MNNMVPFVAPGRDLDALAENFSTLVLALLLATATVTTFHGDAHERAHVNHVGGQETSWPFDTKTPESARQQLGGQPGDAHDRGDVRNTPKLLNRKLSMSKYAQLRARHDALAAAINSLEAKPETETRTL